MNECNKPIETIFAGDVPIDTLDSLPDYIWAERAVANGNTGKNRYTPVRVPAGKLFGGGNFDNVTTIEPNNTIEVPENQVRACRIVNNGSYNTVELTNASNEPDFLAIGNLGGDLLIQESGFIYFPNGHDYIVGQVYYSGANGVPTTNSSSGHKLFKPISHTKLAIKLGE